MLKIDVIPTGVLGTNAVIVGDATARKIWLFDAPDGIGEVLSAYWGMELAGVFLTHGHFDHILGVSEINPPRIWAGEGDRKLLDQPELMAGWIGDAYLSDKLRKVVVTDWISQNGEIEVAGLRIQVRLSPGHSKGGLIYYLPDLATAIVGDTIFRQGIGRTDLPGGSLDELLQSVREQALTLPDETRLIPGHGPTTTVGKEKKDNPYLVDR
jgi:glyoxylase-like metal-dependent hydrolase (beta-lactamase superfamily II)